MDGKSRPPVVGDFHIVDEIINSWISPQWGSFICRCFKESGGMLSGPVAFGALNPSNVSSEPKYNFFHI